MDQKCYQLAPLVSYDDYDGDGYLLGIRQGVLIELDSRGTCILNALLCSVTLSEAVRHLALGTSTQSSHVEVLAFAKRLADQRLIEPGRDSFPGGTSLPNVFLHQQEELAESSVPPVTWQQRWQGAAHILTVLGELCTGEWGFYKAHQYIWKLKERSLIKLIAPASAIELVHREYWFYRLIVGLLERRTAHLIGQAPGNEGLCLIRSLALCAYLLPLGVPAAVVIGRPLYGSRDGFKLHVWVELVEDGTPLNERPNIGSGYRRMHLFPRFA